MTSLPKTYSPLDVAEALGQTEYFVREKARKHEWPHIRVARGQVRFTESDFQQVLELCHRAAAGPAEPTTFLTPGSQRRLSRSRA